VFCSPLFVLLIHQGIPAQAWSQSLQPLQMPWPTGTTHDPGISSAGCSYNCPPGHLGVDYYAIDFNLNTDSPVSAVLAGIAHVVSDSCGGRIVWIDHGGGLISYYGHLDPNNIRVAEGAAVSQAQVIALSDTSGTCATGPHLHFAMHSGATNWLNGSPFMPEPMSGYTGFGAYGVNTGLNSRPSHQ
jgi:murein DD-endopeptidase MepM/ murein hydrolase activator NlpD